jgi:hypothetical protein
MIRLRAALPTPTQETGAMTKEAITATIPESQVVVNGTLLEKIARSTMDAAR